MAKLKLTLAQMHIELGNVNKNLATMEKMVAEAVACGSKMIVFPELFTTGYALEQAKDLSDQLNSGAFEALSGAATAGKIAITGTVLEKRGMAVSNSAPFFTPGGRMVGVYRKIHLFRGLEEDKWLQAGSSPLLLDLPWGPTGMAICYDLRFPELFRGYGVAGASMVIIPAEWPMARIAHWRALLVARAIENQCYIVAVNAVGQIGEMEFGGHSMVVDPWGKIVVEAGETPQLLTVEIEMDIVEEVRELLPVFEDRRPEVY